jgi:heat shock protein 1/8
MICSFERSLDDEPPRIRMRVHEIIRDYVAISSAPVIQHPSQPDTPAYRVLVGADSSTEKILSVHEVAVLFLNSLLASAEAFLGRKPTGLVVSIPSASPDFQHYDTSSYTTSSSLWTHAQHTALLAACATSVPVLQLLESAGATTLSLS